MRFSKQTMILTSSILSTPPPLSLIFFSTSPSTQTHSITKSSIPPARSHVYASFFCSLIEIYLNCARFCLAAEAFARMRSFELNPPLRSWNRLLFKFNSSGFVQQHMGQQKNKEVVNAATSSEPAPPGKKARKLKAGAKIKKKSSKAKVAGSEKKNKEESSKINKEESSKINKEESSNINTEVSNKINTTESNLVKDIGIKVGGIIQGNELKEANSKETSAIKETVAGLIFMCNSRTKPDCFKYKVMGLPENRREFVFSIKPGMWLFLYDFEMKLLHGIFKASSSGGMKLEPAAFNGLYPAQVRFEVESVRAPLHYHIFKNAIKDNFTGIRNMFKIELSIEQVKELTKLFPHLPQQQQQQQQQLIFTNPNVLMPQPPPAPAQVPAFALAPATISRPLNLPIQAPIHPHPFENFSRNHPAQMQREVAPPPFGVMLHNPPKQNTYPAQPAAHGYLPGFFTHPSYSQPWPESFPPQPATDVMLPYGMPRASIFVEGQPIGEPWLGASHVARAADPPNTFNVRNERRFVNSGYQEPPPVSSRYAFAGPTVLHRRGFP